MNQNEIGKIGAVGSEPVKGFQENPVVQKMQMHKQSKSTLEAAPAVANPTFGEIRLSFRVDGSNNDVTITVTDKDSGRVIRTIPFEAMKELSIGELFQFSK